MAALALKHTAQAMGHDIVTESPGGAVATALGANVGLYIVVIAAGTLVTALATVQLKHWFPRKSAVNA